MQFRLRTLLIVLAIGPMMLALPWLAWEFYRDYRAKRVIDEFFSVPVRPDKEPTIYEHIGLLKHPDRKPSSTDNHK
jgi:hypothetical protein